MATSVSIAAVQSDIWTQHRRKQSRNTKKY